MAVVTLTRRRSSPILIAEYETVMLPGGADRIQRAVRLRD
jgi:hypothetical protein